MWQNIQNEFNLNFAVENETNKESTDDKELRIRY